MVTNKTQFVKILSVSLIAFIGLLIVALVTNIIKSASLASKEQELRNQLISLEQTVQKNQTEIEYKQSSDYTDRYAREYLDKSNANEEIYVGISEK